MEHQAGYKYAPEQLYMDNQWIIRQAAYKWRATGYHNQEDIKATATEGLWKAAVSYDPNKGQFQKYATRVVENYLKEFVSKESNQTRYEFSHKPEVEKAERELKKTLNRRPTVKEISMKTGLPESLIKRIKTPITVISIEDLNYEPAVPETGDTADEELIEEVRAAVKTLPDHHRRIIEQLYLSGAATQAEIAENEGISQQAISKRAAAAIEALKSEIQKLAA